MKKFALYFFGLSIVVLTFSSCKSSKKGCGLTSDATKIEQITNNQSVTSADV
jgi:hypothetical protein